MAARSFSRMLAWRYLNPLRAMISSFTIISVLGVLLGVMVLVVVMAVYAGLERQVKDRILGFTPHVLVKGFNAEQSVKWREMAGKLREIPGVASASPSIQDHVVLDVAQRQRPVYFQAIDTQDKRQVEAIGGMLDQEEYPGGSAEMGLDDRVVISSTVAKQFDVAVGDTLRLYSTRNFEQVMAVYKTTEKPVLHERYGSDWKKIAAVLTTGKAAGEKFSFGKEALVASSEMLAKWITPVPGESGFVALRAPEEEQISRILGILNELKRDDEGKQFLASKEQMDELREICKGLGASQSDVLDGQILRDMKQVVLPREAKVIGVYKASMMAMTPEIFMPLHLAQPLAGLDDGVQGIALRLQDPYQAEQVANAVQAFLSGENDEGMTQVMTWMEQYRDFFLLINQQRMMMYFALSFIVLVSAFSMMAVLFTVTIQKRREIGVMKALGATPWQIVRVFLYQGMILGFAGSLLGWGLGRVVIHYRGFLQEVLRRFHFDPFSSSLTGFNVLPAYNQPKEQLAIGIFAFILCSFAALVPALIAARSDAAKSLRNL